MTYADAFKTLFAACLEEVAREEAARIGFDMKTESNALFRMTMTVLVSDDLRIKAVNRAKERMPKESDEKG